MKDMFKDFRDTRNRGGRFVGRKNKHVEDYAVSKFVDSFVNKPNLKSFMM